MDLLNSTEQDIIKMIENHPTISNVYNRLKEEIVSVHTPGISFMRKEFKFVGKNPLVNLEDDYSDFIITPEGKVSEPIATCVVERDFNDSSETYALYDIDGKKLIYGTIRGFCLVPRDSMLKDGKHENSIEISCFSKFGEWNLSYIHYQTINYLNMLLEFKLIDSNEYKEIVTLFKNIEDLLSINWEKYCFYHHIPQIESADSVGSALEQIDNIRKAVDKVEKEINNEFKEREEKKEILISYFKQLEI